MVIFTSRKHLANGLACCRLLSRASSRNFNFDIYCRVLKLYGSLIVVLLIDGRCLLLSEVHQAVKLYAC